MRRRIMRLGAALGLGAIALAAQPALSGPPHCPPGHANKGWCEPSAASHLPPGLRMKAWNGWPDHALRAPRRGERWVEVDGEVFLILDATRQVLEAAGSIDRLLRSN